MSMQTNTANGQTEKIKFDGDVQLIEVHKRRQPRGKPEVVVVTGASAGVGAPSSGGSRRKERTSDLLRVGLMVSKERSAMLKN